MTRRSLAYAVAGLIALPAFLMAQTPPAAPAPARVRPTFEKFTVEGEPVDRRKPELDTDHPVFPGQTRAPYHKTVDLEVTTIATGLDVPWAVELLPSGRFLITEKAGRLRILNKDGSPLHTITANMPPVYFRGQAGLLDVALDRNFATNHRIFYVYLRNLDETTCAHAVDSAILDETAGTISNVTTIFQAAPFTNRAVAQSGSRIAVDPKDGNLFVAVGDRSTGDPLPLQAQGDSHHARGEAGARESVARPAGHVEPGPSHASGAHLRARWPAVGSGARPARRRRAERDREGQELRLARDRARHQLSRHEDR
jgi:glucose/arabinose dehydrogenase